MHRPIWFVHFGNNEDIRVACAERVVHICKWKQSMYFSQEGGEEIRRVSFSLHYALQYAEMRVHCRRVENIERPTTFSFISLKFIIQMLLCILSFNAVDYPWMLALPFIIAALCVVFLCSALRSILFCSHSHLFYLCLQEEGLTWFNLSTDWGGRQSAVEVHENLFSTQHQL